MKMAVKKQTTALQTTQQHLEHAAMNLLPPLVVLPQRGNQGRPVLAAISGSPTARFGPQTRVFVTVLFQEREA